MPICNLIANGKNFDVDQYMASSAFNGKAQIFHRGQTGKHLKSDVNAGSGFSFVINDSEDGLDVFLQKIHETLEKYENEFSVLNDSYEVEELMLRIGIFWEMHTVCSSVALFPALLLFAGKNKIAIEVTTYATSAEG